MSVKLDADTRNYNSAVRMASAAHLAALVARGVWFGSVRP
jgi:hypothetical protein